MERIISPYIDSIDSAAYYMIPRWLRGTKPKFTENEVAKSWIAKALELVAKRKVKSLLDYLGNTLKPSKQLS